MGLSTAKVPMSSESVMIAVTPTSWDFSYDIHGCLAANVADRTITCSISGQFSPQSRGHTDADRAILKEALDPIRERMSEFILPSVYWNISSFHAKGPCRSCQDHDIAARALADWLSADYKTDPSMYAKISETMAVITVNRICPSCCES